MIACGRLKVYAIHIMYSARRIVFFYFISYFWYSRCSYKEGYVEIRAPDLTRLYVVHAWIEVQYWLLSYLFLYFGILSNFQKTAITTDYCQHVLTDSIILLSSLNFEFTWWRLFEKRIGCTKLDIYVFITNHI
jgi:hypothetical protein